MLPRCWSSQGVTLSRWVHVDSLRGTAWSSRSFFHQLNHHWFLQLEVVGTHIPGTRNLGWVTFCGIGTPCSWDLSQIFIHHMWCGTGLLCICALPTSLDRCGFFNSVVVRLPFNSISDGSEWWLFCILVLIWCGCVKKQAVSAYTAILTGSLFPFLFGFFFFLVLCCVRSFYILEIKLLSNVSLASMFSHTVVSHFSLMMDFSCWVKHFNLM